MAARILLVDISLLSASHGFYYEERGRFSLDRATIANSRHKEEQSSGDICDPRRSRKLVANLDDTCYTNF